MVTNDFATHGRESHRKAEDVHPRLWFLTTVAIFAMLLLASMAHASDVDVKSYGAAGDGKALDSGAIQKAIDACAGAGGGTVRVPAGQYLCGSILLKDNVTLHLDDGASLIGSTNLNDYRAIEPFKEGLGNEVGYAFLGAADAKQIAIEGKGIIDGRGKAIADAQGGGSKGWSRRPFLVRLVRCQGVSLQGVQLRNAGAWGLNLFQCHDVAITGVTISSRGVPHNDGIDADSCDGVQVKDCDIDSGDDALCLKATSPLPCRNVTASGCKLKSSQGAIKLGTESIGDFQNITISDCQIHDTRNGGIKLLSVDGSHLQHVSISDITMDNVATPIFLRLGARLKTFREGDTKRDVGILKDVTIRNVKAKAASKAQLMPPSGVFITGIPGHPIEDVTLENIEIELAGGGTAEQGHERLPEKEDVYPEINRFGPRLPAYGVFARHVKGLKINNFLVKLDSPDARPALVCEDADGLSCANWSVPVDPKAECVVRLDSVQHVALSQFQVTSGQVPVFLDLQGKGSRDVSLANNDVNAAKAFELGEDVAKDSVKVR